MKKTFLFFLIIISIIANAQTDTTFSDLKGLDDNQGHTHLFFRMHFSTTSTNYRNIYELNVTNNNLSLFLSDYNPNNHYVPGKEVYAYDFWDNDPNKYISCGLKGLIFFWTTDGYISRFQGVCQPPSSLAIHGLMISQSEGGRVYCYALPQSQEYVSNDSGLTWTSAPFTEHISWINKFNDEMYAARNDVLLKTSDLGNNFVASDSQFVGTKNFLNDADSIHIYRTASTYPPLKYHLVVSDSNGNYGSWYSSYSSNNEILFSIDASQSGHLYLADRNVILISTDFGSTFSEFYTMSAQIKGIYKKPSSNILYTMDAQNLYQFTDTIPIIIKSLNPVSVDAESGLITQINLSQNYPNPFNPTTKIRLQSPVSSWQTLKVYDVLGKEVTTLVNEEKPSGNYEVEFDASDLSSGVYFYILKAGDFIQSKKMILMK